MNENKEIDLSEALSIESINIYCGKLKTQLNDVVKILNTISNDKTIPSGYRLLIKEYVSNNKLDTHN